MQIIKSLSFSFFITVFICSTSNAQRVSFPNPNDDIAQIFGGNIVQGWNPLAHKVVLVRSILDETKVETPEMIRTNQTRKNCSGVLIRPRIVLTAAHCHNAEAIRQEIIFSVQPDQLTASEKALLDTPEEKKIRSTVTGKVLLGDLTPDMPVDLALLKIATPAPFPYLPVQMTSLSEANPTAVALRLTGYGRSDDLKNTERRLRTVEVTTEPFRRDDTEIIVDQRQGKGICNGDSGGPMLVYDRGEYKVIGINSYVFNYHSEPAADDACRAFGAAVHLGPFRSLIQQAIETLEKAP